MLLHQAHSMQRRGVASISMKLSGLPLAPLITPGTIGFCLNRVLTTHIAGFIATYLLGFEESQE